MASALSDITQSVDGPMVVVTCSVGDERAGCLVGFHTQTSIDPERYAVWISKANRTYELAIKADRFGVHFLSEDQHELAKRFGAQSGDDVDKFAGLELDAQTPPLIKDIGNRLVVVRTALLDDGGDHVGIVGDVIDTVHARDDKPFRVSQADFEAGHDPHERHA